MRRRLTRIIVLGSMLATLTVASASSQALAYGNVEQWQIGFSATCNNTSLCPAASGIFQSPGTFGFWGWCAFGGSNGSSAVGTTGNTADCQFSFYTRPPVDNVTHFTYDVTGWIIKAGSALLFVPPGAPTFFVTGGSFEVQGPGAANLGLPTGVPIPFPNPCPAVLCDTGLLAVPGHFASDPFAGYHVNMQVNKLP